MSLVVHRLESRVLAGNPLGDPAARNLTLYLPPGFEASAARRYPALLALVGFTGTGAQLFNPDPLGEDLERRLDRLIGGGLCQPVIVAAPDCFTRVGGSQYMNTSAVGRYEDYLVEEIVPFVEKSYPTAKWGVFGKSSGGYGALGLGMRYPERFGAVACHSGDCGFELCYLPDFAAALSEFHAAGGPAAWLDRFWAADNRRQGRFHKPLGVLGMAAHYSPNPRSPHLGIDFPFDLETGAFRPEIWQKWREHDPVHLVDAHAQALRRLSLLYIDCGTADEFGLIWGARTLVAKLRALGVPHHYEEFDGGHMNTSYRYDRSLPLLAKALST